jgi:protein O-GlcNAc transferase
VGQLPAIENGYLTFGSFSRCSKLSEEVIALWAKLLRAIPNARLLIGGMPLDGQPPRLEVWFNNEGIAPDRLKFHPRDSVHEYLALHHQVDICLDPFPYTGATTTCHAMWMGVPTLTLAGRTVAGRLGAALLTHAGLKEFVAASEQDFVTKGKAWASKPELLAHLRSGMRQQFARSIIGQPQLMARSFAKALRGIWTEWCADSLAATNGKKPSSSKRRRQHSLTAQGPTATESRELSFLLRQGHSSNAETMARTLTVRSPMQGTGWKALGVALDQQGRDEEALEALERAALLLPNDAEALRNLCGALLKAGEAPEAEIACRAALTIKPNAPESWSSLGAVLIHLKRFVEAEKACRKVLDLRSNLAQDYGNLGAALMWQERFAEAESNYRLGMELSPCDPEMLRNWGVALQRQGRLADAEEQIRQALAIDPEFAKAHSDLGAALLVQGRCAEAERSMRDALRLDLNLNEARSNLGSALVRLGRSSDGEAMSRLATQIDPAFPDAWTNMGAALEAQGRFAESNRQLPARP